MFVVLVCLIVQSYNSNSRSAPTRPNEWTIPIPNVMKRRSSQTMMMTHACFLIKNVPVSVGGIVEDM